MPVHDTEVAEALERVADLLEIDGANPFRVRAYRRAAGTVRSLSDDLRSLVEDEDQRDLVELPGIGASLAEHIAELVRTRSFPLLERLEERFPDELPDLLKVEGLGPKKVRKLYTNLEVEDLDDLREAAEGGEIQELEGFGERSEERILEGLPDEGEPRTLWRDADPVARELRGFLSGLDAVDAAEVAGSYRRLRPTVGDLDVVVRTAEGEEVIEAFTAHEDVVEVLSQGETRASVRLRSGLQVDLRAVEAPAYGAALLYFTGSREHGIRLRRRAQGKGWKLNEYGLWEDDTRLAGRSEEEVYAVLDMSFVPPELREAAGEVEAAAEGALPDLVTLDDIRGDLHAHTEATDGADSLEEMARAARERGYEYLAITDHSQSTRVAGGLSPDELEDHIERIRALDERLDDLELLAGAEVDILEDGRLDYPDSLLQELDLVLCSVHSAFDLDPEEQLRRLRKVLANPHVNILGHPLGRKVGGREGIEVDLDAVFRDAREAGVAVELDGQPERLDLPAAAARRARDAGVQVSVSSDAHSAEQLHAMRHGVGQARRAWLEAGDVLETRPLEELRRFLRRSP